MVRLKTITACITAVLIGVGANGATSTACEYAREKQQASLKLASAPCTRKCSQALDNCLGVNPDSRLQQLCYDLYGTCLRRCR